MYNTKLNSIESSLELPKYFKPVSMCLNETRDKVVAIVMRKGEQDLMPTGKSSSTGESWVSKIYSQNSSNASIPSFDILPYQEHYYYIINIHKFKVRPDGKLNRYMGMGLVHAEKLTHNLTHIKHIKDSYFVGSSDKKIHFYELDSEAQKFTIIEGVPEIKLDSSEVDVLTKSMSTKLLKDEILAFEAYGLLKQEVTRDIQ